MMYRAPEMVDLYREDFIDTKVDIWSLGCMVYKLAFYNDPFEGKLGILNGRYRIPDNSIYSSRLHNFIAYLLQTDPVKRPDIFDVLQTLGVNVQRPVTQTSRPPRRTNNEPASPKPVVSRQLQNSGGNGRSSVVNSSEGKKPSGATTQAGGQLFSMLDWHSNDNGSTGFHQTAAANVGPTNNSGFPQQTHQLKLSGSNGATSNGDLDDDLFSDFVGFSVTPASAPGQQPAVPKETVSRTSSPFFDPQPTNFGSVPLPTPAGAFASPPVSGNGNGKGSLRGSGPADAIFDPFGTSSNSNSNSNTSSPAPSLHASRDDSQGIQSILNLFTSAPSPSFSPATSHPSSPAVLPMHTTSPLAYSGGFTQHPTTIYNTAYPQQPVQPSPYAYPYGSTLQQPVTAYPQSQAMMHPLAYTQQPLHLQPQHQPLQPMYQQQQPLQQQAPAASAADPFAGLLGGLLKQSQ
eukprot:TRINITY_DN3848_c0_g1_i2.p1 TRINITY_DN3848_c0_g1~~TRINITY_DN3848_c0_g1_i2.p1  ORF type:complete len:460 (-),score=81.45 TRINITY_DN3848_c0_g1_i2:83-1462(-)